MQPLADRVLIRPMAPPALRASGLELPQTVQERPQEGIVLAAGPGVATRADKRTPLSVVAGDVVLYGKYGATEISLDGEDLLMLRESDLVATVC